jgi:DNA polymerase epsilon subunit 4
MLNRPHVPANAITYQGNLEFLEDIIPKTVPYKKVKDSAAAKRAELLGEKPNEETFATTATNGSGRKQKNVNGGSANGSFVAREELSEDPNDQLEMEMQQAAASADRDVDMMD